MSNVYLIARSLGEPEGNSWMLSQGQSPTFNSGGSQGINKDWIVTQESLQEASYMIHDLIGFTARYLTYTDNSFIHMNRLYEDRSGYKFFRMPSEIALGFRNKVKEVCLTDYEITEQEFIVDVKLTDTYQAVSLMMAGGIKERPPVQARDIDVYVDDTTKEVFMNDFAILSKKADSLRKVAVTIKPFVPLDGVRSYVKGVVFN